MKEREVPLQGPISQKYLDALAYFSGAGRFYNLFTRERDYTPQELEEAEKHLDTVFSTMMHDPAPHSLVSRISWLFRTIRQNPGNQDNKKRFTQESIEKFTEHAQWFADQIGRHGEDTDRIIGNLFWETTRSVNKRDPRDVRTLVRVVDKHFPYLKEKLFENPLSYIDYFLFYFQYTYSTKKYEKALAVCEQLLEQNPDRGFFLSLSMLFNSDGAGIRHAREHLLHTRITQFYNINPDTLLNAWKASSYVSRRDKRQGYTPGEIIRSLETMDALEQCYPGSVQYLFSEYGIRHFGRYPRVMLLEQFEKRNERDEHTHIVILYPYDDHNGAFHENRVSLLDLFSKAKEFGIHVRVIEARSGRDVIRRLNHLVRKHGKAGGILVGGHGTETSIQFGPHGEPGAIVSIWDIRSWQDLLRQAAQKFLIPHASIALNSCSTGKWGWFAQELSKYGFSVTAPASSTSIRSLTLAKDGDLPSIEPEFCNPTSMRRYKDGKRRNKRS